jgi:hypothetical protein
MQVKGIGLITTNDFVKSKHPNEHADWVNSLPLQSKEYYSTLISATGWYPFYEGFLVPMKSIADRFFASNEIEAANQLGRFSAENALTGIYKIFLMIASPEYLIKKGSQIFARYYNPCSMEIANSTSKSSNLRITQFDNINKAFEHRLGAWCVRAVELTNKKNVNYKIIKSLASGDHYTEIFVTWE